MTNELPEEEQLKSCRQVVLDTLEKVSPGEMLSFENLDIVPLHIGNGHALPYLLLWDAIEAGVLEVTEVDESGEVPRLKVVNKADKPVLILAGDELIGAKQNRIVNATMIVPAAADLVMPVSCVERGRWNYRSRTFAAGRRASYRLRRETTRDVRRNVRETGEFDSDQGRVWSEVDNLNRAMGAASPTDAMAAGFDKAAGKLEKFKERLAYPEKATGLAVFINGRLVGLELFEHPDILRKVWDSHVQSYAIDAITVQKEARDGAPSTEAVNECSRRITESLEAPRKSPGEGYDVGLEEADLVGAALVNDGRVVHLQTFSDPVPDEGEEV
ncbi:MAG: ARPP-1 family domain-containing protein [bacterium]